VNKVLRGAAVLAAAGLAVPLWAVPSASAASVNEAASIGAYFYSAGVDKPEQSPAAPPNVTADQTDGVAPGNLAVAVRVPNQTDKMSFLFFDLLSVPLDATINSAVVTVPLAEPTPPLTPPRDANVQRNPAPEKVRVCAAGPEGFNGEDGASFAAAPAVDCESFSAVGTASADKKSYTFDITGLASEWLSGMNNGLALVPAEEALRSEFQVVFQPSDAATIAAQFTAPEPADLGTEFDAPVTTTPPVDGGFSSGGTFDSGSAFGDSSSFGSAEAPLVDTALPEPQTMEAPAPEPDVAPAAPIRNVALGSDIPLTPSPAFWAGLVALGALLAFLGLIMGDSRVPAPGAAAASPTRLSRALQERQRGDARGSRMTRPLSI
jgi:hypothetical protein